MPSLRHHSANGIDIFLLEQGEGPLVIVEGAGHWIQQERADEVNAALIGFLKQNAG